MSEKRSGYELEELNPEEVFCAELDCRLFTAGTEEFIKEQLDKLARREGDYESRLDVFIRDVVRIGYIPSYASSFLDDVNEYEKMFDLLSYYEASEQ